jgi:hypothetical protein
MTGKLVSPFAQHQVPIPQKRGAIRLAHGFLNAAPQSAALKRKAPRPRGDAARDAHGRT